MPQVMARPTVCLVNFVLSGDHYLELSCVVAVVTQVNQCCWSKLNRH